MRHGDKINNLGRTASHRRALLANMAISLIEHKRITTTLAKARALRRYVEPLVTKAKSNTTHDRRVVFSYLQNKEAIKELFGTIATKVADRPGGYVRVIKLGFRRGDGAETAMIEFVDFNEVYNPNEGKERKTKRTRRGSAKKGAEVMGVADETNVVDSVVDDTAVAEMETAAPDVVEETLAPVEEAVVETLEVAEAVVETPVAAVEEVVEAVAEAPAEETPAADAPAEEEKKDENAA